MCQVSHNLAGKKHMELNKKLQRERDGGGGQPPVKSEVRAQSNKVGRLWFFCGGRCLRISRGDS